MVHLRATLDLFLDVQAAGFAFMDAGPHNLATWKTNAGVRVVFLDWEHVSKGKTKRKILNQSFTRFISEAAAHMAAFPSWSEIGSRLTTIARENWWLLVPDHLLDSEDRSWLAHDLATITQQLLRLFPAPPPIQDRKEFLVGSSSTGFVRGASSADSSSIYSRLLGSLCEPFM